MKVAFAFLAAFALISVPAGTSAHQLVRGASVSTDAIATADDGKSADVPSDLFPPEVEASESEDEERKEDKHQKRQKQRDRRRDREDPDRSQGAEDRERKRKHDQSKRRGDRCSDPYEPDCSRDEDYPGKREKSREKRCKNRGSSCNYGRDDTDEPNERRREADKSCKRACGGDKECKRKCMALTYVEDSEYISNFLEKADVPFVARFLKGLSDEDLEVFM